MAGIRTAISIEALVVGGALVVVAVVAVALLRHWARRSDTWESKLDQVMKPKDDEKQDKPKQEKDEGK